MPTILKIGYQAYLVKNPKQAADAIKALADMVALDQKYQGGRALYWVDEERQPEIAFQNIRDNQLLANEPADIDEEPPRKVLSLPPPR